jgi:hypothetical protein
MLCPGPGQQTAACYSWAQTRRDTALHEDATTADLEFDQALANAVRSSVDIAESSSEAPHADLNLAAHVGVAA